MGEGGDVAIREEQAWLLQSRINPLPAAGTLELRDGRISFTLEADGGEGKLAWLEDQLGIDGLGEKLAAGEKIVAFDYALEECRISWPLTGGGAVMYVEPAGRKWVLTYDDPGHRGSRFSQPLAMSSGRKRAREWKQALAAAHARA